MADQHVEQVLKELGFGDADIKELKELKADAADFTTDKYIAPVRTGYETRLENDPDFLKKIITDERVPAEVKKAIESGQYGRFMNETKAFLLSKGVTEDELKEAWEKKSLKGILDSGFTGYSKKVGAPETLTALQGQLATALQEKESLTKGQQKLIDDAVNGAKSDSQILLEKMAAKQTISDLNGFKEGEGTAEKVFEFKVAPGIVAGIIHDGVKEKYAVILNPATGDFEIRQKADPTLKVLTTGGKEVSYAQAAIAYAKAKDLVQERKAAGGKKEAIKTTVEVEGENTKVGAVIPAYIKKSTGIKED